MNKEVTEEDPLKPTKRSGEALVKVEQLLLAKSDIEFTILRFGGLIGEDRNPVKYMAGKHIEKGSTPVNLIHRDDCIGIIERIIQKEAWGEIFNAVADEHPTKSDFYTAAAKAKGLLEPTFGNETDGHKIISNKKIKNALGYEFIYPGPMGML